jgi:hypothetical protein
MHRYLAAGAVLFLASLAFQAIHAEAAKPSAATQAKAAGARAALGKPAQAASSATRKARPSVCVI